MTRFKTALLGVIVMMTSGRASAEDRFPTLKPAQMSPAQKTVADAIMAGPRGSIGGPFNAWLRAPELADRLQKVGEYIRYKTSLAPRLSEFAILVVARAWTSQYEWYAHYPLAMKGGLDAKVAADLASGKRPASMKDDEQLVYDLGVHLQRDKGNIPDGLYQAALAQFGEQGVVELIALNGYYSTVSMTLNVARVALPAGEPLPLPILE